MIELQNNRLVFSFPELHPNAKLEITFHRTLRIPDDGKRHSLPPSLGAFPLRHVDDFSERVPESWRRRGGVMFPMYQAEAMWVSFSSPHQYPFAVKIAAGKINAVTGEEWTNDLQQYPQNYMVVPGQPWIDGYVVEKGVIRQFVAMPLGNGYSVEEQITGEAENGGIQIQVFPLKKALYTPPVLRNRSMVSYSADPMPMVFSASASMNMGLGAGGSMRQEIYNDRRSFSDWDQNHSSRCFVHLTNAMVWRMITGQEPPTVPPTAEEYTRRGLPWFDYYAADQTALDATNTLKKVQSVKQIAEEKGEVALPENQSVDPKNVLSILAGKLSPTQVREGEF